MASRRARREHELAGDPNDPEGLHVWSRRYFEWLLVRNYSERTIENRRYCLSDFIRWADARAIGRPAEVSRALLEGYQRHLFYSRKKNGKPLSFRSQHSRLVPVRALFRWLARQNVIPNNPASELELPRLERRLPKYVLTATEAEHVMAQPDIGDALGVRDRAILEVLYSTGIRRRDLIGLHVCDVDVERGTLTVRQGKGRRDRMVPIGERAAAWLEKYIAEMRPTLLVPPDEGTVFLTTMGEAFSPRRLTQMVKRYVDAAELGKYGSCHLFRHTMATLMLEGGADIRFVQEMLGHVLISTTQIYAQVSIRKLKEIHAATHPSAKLERRVPTPATGGDVGEDLAEVLGDLAAEDDES